MTKRAIAALLKWAENVPKAKQARFAEFYAKHASTYAHDEAYGGNADGVLTVEGMEALMRAFESYE